MDILTGILLALAALILIAFVTYLLWRHANRTIDSRPEDVAQLAQEQGWDYSLHNERLTRLIAKNKLGYMGRSRGVEHVCTNQIDDHEVYIFDCVAATTISGVAVEFPNCDLPPFFSAEHLILNRLRRREEVELLDPKRLPQFVRAKVGVYSRPENHHKVAELIDGNLELQRLLKERDHGFFTMRGTVAVFYFLTRYPADERGFGRMKERAERMIDLFGAG